MGIRVSQGQPGALVPLLRDGQPLGSERLGVPLNSLWVSWAGVRFPLLQMCRLRLAGE